MPDITFSDPLQRLWGGTVMIGYAIDIDKNALSRRMCRMALRITPEKMHGGLPRQIALNYRCADLENPLPPAIGAQTPLS